MAIYKNYFLLIITVFAFYQLIFFYLVRPYYLKALSLNNIKSNEIPQVAFEVVYLMVIILGLAVATVVQISPYVIWAIILLIYGLAIKTSKQPFFLASALLFKMHRGLDYKKQLQQQTNIIFAVCVFSGIIFFVLSYFIPNV